MVMISLVTMSQEVSKEIPKEVKSSSQKWSLTSENELSYDGKPYTGKVILDKKGGKGYLNLKDGHLEGYSYMESQVFETSFNALAKASFFLLPFPETITVCVDRFVASIITAPF